VFLLHFEYYDTLLYFDNGYNNISVYSIVYMYIPLYVCLLLALRTLAQTEPTIYVYAYSWTPGFCYKQSYPGCLDPLPYWKQNLTIHGLWPQYTTSGYPSFCSTEPFDTKIPAQIGETTMVQYWPDVQYTVDSPSYDSFWEHEWTKHGTCSGLSQTQYFNNAIWLAQRFPTPSVLYDSIGHTMSANELRKSMGGANFVALQCNNQVLNGMYTCWDQSNNIPNNQIQCPAEVVKEDTCMSSDDITIVQLSA